MAPFEGLLERSRLNEVRAKVPCLVLGQVLAQVHILQLPQVRDKLQDREAAIRGVVAVGRRTNVRKPVGSSGSAVPSVGIRAEKVSVVQRGLVGLVRHHEQRTAHPVSDPCDQSVACVMYEGALPIGLAQVHEDAKRREHVPSIPC